MGTFGPKIIATARGPVEITHAEPDDAERVLEYAADLFAASPYTLTSRGEFTMTTEQEREFLRTHREGERSIFLIATVPARPEVLAGLVITGGAKRKIAHHGVLGMGVRGGWRGVGVGRAILSAAIDWARGVPGLEIITLAVYAANEPAMRLYRSMGFVEHGRMPRCLKHEDGTEWENVDMHLRLRERADREPTRG